MSLTSNPTYRYISIEDRRERPPRLSWAFRVLRWAAYLYIAALMGYFLQIGYFVQALGHQEFNLSGIKTAFELSLRESTVESRTLYVLAFFVAFIRPVWGFYALALLGPLFLVDASKHHLLACIEVLVLGIFTAELRLWGRPVVSETEDGSLIPQDRKVDWGLWPYLLTGLALLLAGSFLMGLHLILFQEADGRVKFLENRVLNSFVEMFYLDSTQQEWTIRSLWNWVTGMLLGCVAARRATPLVFARFLKIGGVSLAIACFFGYLDWLGWLPLSQIRVPNPDPLHAGRFQGTGGHAGWFAEWIVLFWPGLFLWWSWGRNKRNAVLGAAVAFIMLALVLTAARADWLGVLVASSVAILYAIRNAPRVRRYIPIAIVLAVVAVGLGVLVGGDTLARRLHNILRASDRANYYVSSFHFLRENPLGIGLGTHFKFYQWWMTPAWRWAQFDHVTAHSLWLHTLVENGPLVPLLILTALGFTGREVRKAWPLFDEGERTIVLMLSLSLIGIMVVSVAQYTAYIRIVEVCVWLSFGGIVGICRKKRRAVASPVWAGPHATALLLICGTVAISTGIVNSTRLFIDHPLRRYERTPDGALEFWTGKEWSTVINNDIDMIRFSLFRKGIPVNGEIIWPDGNGEKFHIEPGEYRYFEWHRNGTPNVWYEKPTFIQLKLDTLFTPAEYDEDAHDVRQLGVLVDGMKFGSVLRERNNEPIMRF